VTAAPGEPCLVEVFADERQGVLGLWQRESVEVDPDQLDQTVALVGRQARHDDALGRQDEVVAARAGEMPTVPRAGEFGREVRRAQRGPHQELVLPVGAQGAAEPQGDLGLVAEGRDALEPSRPRRRLGTEEHGGEHHLPADEDAVQVHVMTHQLPAPRGVVRRGPEDGEPVGELREGVAVAVDELAQVLVERHRRSHLSVTGGAEARLHDGERAVAVTAGLPGSRRR
jgi:hypothetical protein